MNTTFKLITTSHCGGTSGIAFDDRAQSGDHPNPVISKIGVCYSTCVYTLQVVMKDGAITTHGNDDGRLTFIDLGAGEFVKRIEGRANDTSVVALTFVTNTRTYGPYGGTHGNPFEWGAVNRNTPDAPRMWLLSFSGHSDVWLYGLQATFAEESTDRLPTIRHESLSARETPTGITHNLSPELSKSFSSFTHHLMSPIITLYIGPAKVKFHVYEDTLCGIPFFHAALRGNFKEATEQAITMPEDTLCAVSALIEFLYTGNYTSTYDPATAQLHKGSTVPVGTITEGLFHVDIHAIASKYDCAGLAAIAARNFKVVAAELGSLDSLQAWQAAYSAGLRLPGEQREFGAYCGGNGLGAWVKCLFADHAEELKVVMAECPEMGFDLFRMAVSEE